ncbi:MAG: hypothetical protein L3J35_08695 [Bacteroidales bacterium]|nr:hypothetical protein [Bacteroidales bacterium]
MAKHFQIILIISFLITSFFSCKPKPAPKQEIDLSKGIFIINEGNFMSNNGEISFYNTASGELINNLYAKQNNNAVLGDVVQSMCIIDTLGLISVNNSRKIEIVDIKKFKHINTITDISYPRYIIPVRKNICYITNGKNSGEVCVIDVSAKKIIKRIPAGSNPENLLLLNNKVFVANGAWGHDSTITVINAETDEIITTTSVGDGTTDLVSSTNNNLWILCQGKSIYDYPTETASQLVCINPETYEIIERINIGITGDDYYPVRLASDKKNGLIYYLEKSGVYKLSINNPQQKELFITGSYYGLEVNQENGNIYVFNDNGFSGTGTMTIYNKSGNKISKPLKVGIGPNGAII